MKSPEPMTTTPITSPDLPAPTIPALTPVVRHTRFSVAAFRILLILIDIIALIAGFLSGYWALRHFPLVPPTVPVQPVSELWGVLLPTLLLDCVTMLTVFFFARLYHQRRALSRIDQTSAIIASVSIGAVMTGGLSAFVFKNTPFDIDYSRQLVLYVWLFTLITALIGREVHRQLVTRLRVAGYSRDRVLLVGSGEAAQTIARQILSRPELGYVIVGAANGMNGASHDAIEVTGGTRVPILGPVEQLPELIDMYQIDEVILALPNTPHDDLVRLIGLSQRGRVEVRVYPDLFAYMAGGVGIDDLGGLPLLTVRDMPMRGWKLTLKRGLDVVGSVIGLVMLSPFMLLTAIAIKLESPGPSFFCQPRTGLDGRPFTMIKFRTMGQNSEIQGPGWTKPGDARVTRLGRWMRRTNWDEIPNLINVLLGSMSLVGPRPEQTYFVEKFKGNIPRYMERHREKVGMTGWAQVNGYRGDTSIADRVKYDLYYVENWSLWLDIKIIIRTIVQTILNRNDNAY